MNQIQKLLCYSGLEVQDYRDCQPEIEEEESVFCESTACSIASPLWCARACVLWI